MFVPFRRSPVWLLSLLATLPVHAQEEAAPQTLKPVVVTATRNERAIDEAPVRTELVTREERRDMKAEAANLPIPVVPPVLQRPATAKRSRRVIGSTYLG